MVTTSVIHGTRTPIHHTPALRCEGVRAHEGRLPARRREAEDAPLGRREVQEGPVRRVLQRDAAGRQHDVPLQPREIHGGAKSVFFLSCLRERRPSKTLS